MAIVKNGMTRSLSINPPLGEVIVSGTVLAGMTITIPPGEAAEVPFWDAVKHLPFFDGLLASGKISVGSDTPNGEPNYTSMGETLTAPDKFDPAEIVSDEKAKEINLSYQQAPTVATKRSRSRKAD